MKSNTQVSKDLEIISIKHELTPAQYKLLQVVVTPEVRTMSVVDQCQLADISRDTYYRSFKDERFINAYLEGCRVLLLTYAAPVLASVGESGARGDTAAAKMVLEMLGFYRPTANLNIGSDTASTMPSLREIWDKENRKEDKNND
ncbi:MAG: hypothetical protein ACM3UZ_03800 [Acidobacteriota bacterium]